MNLILKAFHILDLEGKNNKKGFLRMSTSSDNEIKNRDSLEAIKKEALERVKKILDKHDVDYWLDCGALLGAIRDDKFLEWESDIDLGILPKDFHKIEPIRKELSNNGFKVFYLEWKEHYFTVKRGIRIDLTRYNVENDRAFMFISNVGKIGAILDYLLWVSSINNAEEKVSKMPKIVTNGLIKLVSILPKFFKKGSFKNISVLYKKSIKKIRFEFPIEYFTNLTTMNFYGINVQIPAKVEEYLEYRYGKNWRIPQKNWEYEKKESY